MYWLCSLPRGASKIPRSPTIIARVSFLRTAFPLILPLASMYEAYTERKKKHPPPSPETSI